MLGVACCHNKTLKFRSHFGIGHWTEAESIHETLKALKGLLVEAQGQEGLILEEFVSVVCLGHNKNRRRSMEFVREVNWQKCHKLGMKGCRISIK